MSLRQAVLAETDEWRVSDVHCTSGPQDKPYQEAHRDVAISLIAQGTFEYRTASGEAVLYPGAYLLGNAGQCFECGHHHGVGDHCIAVHVSRPLFEEIATTVTGSSRFEFQMPSLPPLKQLSVHSAMLQSLPANGPAGALSGGIYGLIEAAIRIASPRVAGARRLAVPDARRISHVLRHIETHVTGELNLDTLAAAARMSKFHFLRTFRRVTGATPHQYVIGLRLRRAAVALRHSNEPIVQIVLDAGFEDVSTFNRYFRQAYKMTPTQHRRNGV
jgi:AraC family transcriptional regulator